MANDDKLIQIGEFARRANTNLRTLRYYEELGLIEPAARSEGGFRYYAVGQLDRIASIKRLQELGLPLKEIAAALGNGADTPSPASVLSRLQPAIQGQIDLTEQRIARLRDDLAQLETARDRLAEMCQHCSLPFSLDHCDPCRHDRTPMPAVLRALLTL